MFMSSRHWECDFSEGFAMACGYITDDNFIWVISSSGVSINCDSIECDFILGAVIFFYIVVDGIGLLARS